MIIRSKKVPLKRCNWRNFQAAADKLWTEVWDEVDRDSDYGYPKQWRETENNPLQEIPDCEKVLFIVIQVNVQRTEDGSHRAFALVNANYGLRRQVRAFETRFTSTEIIKANISRLGALK